MEINPEMVTIFSLITNGVLVGIVIIQYRLSLQQYETVNRPWLVLRKKGIIYDTHIRWYLENIGNLPAKEITITSKPQFHYDDKESKIPKIEGEPIKIGIIMPKQKFDFAFNYFEIHDDEASMEIEIEINIKYKFLNRKKSSKFRYYKHDMIDHEEITCVEAN